MDLDVSAGGAFLAGLLSFASPCVLPLVPPYLAFIGGVSIEELGPQGGKGIRWRVLSAALAFVAGFSSVFVALGATASWLGQAVSAHLGILGYVAGILIAIMGLHFLRIIRIPFMDRTAKVGLTERPAGLVGAYLIGLAFGFGWSPCVGPVLTAILLLASAKDTVGEGAWLLLVYSLGIGVPFLVAAAFASAFMRWSARFKKRLGLIEKAMGAFLVLTGVLVFTGQLANIAFWLLETFPVLNKLG
ncbi:MAG: cytochrome c biogenesis protein CcdA [Pseudolabrys sp.]|jgi:cytochrome c-type biogenesis protein